MYHIAEVVHFHSFILLSFL